MTRTPEDETPEKPVVTDTKKDELAKLLLGATAAFLASSLAKDGYDKFKEYLANREKNRDTK